MNEFNEKLKSSLSETLKDTKDHFYRPITL